MKRKKHNSKAVRGSEAIHVVLSALGYPSRGGLRRYLNERYMSLDPAIFARTVFEDVLSGVLLKEKEEDLGEGSPLPPDEDNEDTRQFRISGLHFSKLRSR